MNNVILTILSLSASGSILALILIVLRPLLKKKVSKMFQYYIWLLVLLRLVLPFSFDGSIMDQIVSQTAMGQTQTQAVSSPDHSGKGMETTGDTDTQGNAISGTSNGSSISSVGHSSAYQSARFNFLQFVFDHLTFVWLSGAAACLGWFIIAYLSFSLRIKKTNRKPHFKDMEVFARLRGNRRVRLACNPYIDTPMLVGFLSPYIVIPHIAFVENGIKAELEHILWHELTHYRRRDLLYKWLTVLVSSLHWFNPLMMLVRREINRACELSCDEAVLRSLNAARRQDYGETLLAIASNKRLTTGIVTTTMCEGKRDLKERLESIMTYKKSKSVLMVVLSLVLALLLAGCGVALGAANAINQTPYDSQSSAAANTPGVSENSSADNHSVLEAYDAVLQNKAEFFSTDNKKNISLNDFLTNKEIYETIFSVTHFTVLDMDGDKIPEVVLELSVGGEPQFYEVLHYMNDAVYGYLIDYRGLEGLKEDGTFCFSNGAADGGWGTLKFASTAYTTDMIGYSQSSQGDPTLAVSYFVNHQSVTKESFDSFMGEQLGKKDAVWQEFSQENIETELSENP